MFQYIEYERQRENDAPLQREWLQDGQLTDGSIGFTESKEDSNLYFKVEGERLVMLLLYVDDLFLTGKEELFKDARRILATEFKMKYLEIMHYFLGMEVWKNEN